MSPYRLPDSLLEQILHEDVPCGDATSFALGLADQPGRMVFRARQAMVLCGSEEAERLGQLHGLTADRPPVASGTPLAAGDEILTLTGRAGDLHAVWKTAQTLMEALSGIASATAAIVEAARRGHRNCAVACTRKNFPGTKAAAIKAVLCGGAAPHRLGLSETLLVFAEHRAFLGSEAPADTLARLHRQWPERKVVVEVGDVAEAALWLAAGAEVLQLEKFSPEAVAEVVRLAAATGSRVVIAAAGGVNAGNAETYARAGAHLLVTSAPYLAPPRDVAVSLTPLATAPTDRP